MQEWEGCPFQDKIPAGVRVTLSWSPMTDIKMVGLWKRADNGQDFVASFQHDDLNTQFVERVVVPALAALEDAVTRAA